MNKKQKWLVSLAAFIVVYTIVWLFSPGWKATKILGILSGVFTVIALYLSYRAEEKNKKDSS